MVVDIICHERMIFMKNRLISTLLALLMLLAAIPTVRAFSDTDGHWARDYIDQAVALELFNGVSSTSFEPESTMTRGMFVTVLGRMEGVDPAAWSSDKAPQFFTDVAADMYYAPYISWAVCNGIVDGTSPTTFAPDTPVTREQMAKLIAFYVRKMGHELLAPDQAQVIPDGFADEADIAPWAAESVDILRQMGILNGLPNADGSISFLPLKTSSRAECATVFCRLYDALLRSNQTPVLPETMEFTPAEVTLKMGQTEVLQPVITPAEAASVSLIWKSSDPSVMTVDENGAVTCVGLGKAEITVYAPNGLSASCTVICASDTLASADETRLEKCLRLFGEVVNDPRLYYAGDDGVYSEEDYARAAADMAEITVRTWDIGSDGEKYTRQFTVLVHKNLAPTVQQIFEEIYNGEEKFPIHYVGGFSHGGRSEHTIGCAIDINPEENYYYNPSTGQTVGSYWKPGEDPYSIPLDGEVAKIFAKYGFTQGAYWSSAVDYMHFSYFGT